MLDCSPLSPAGATTTHAPATPSGHAGGGAVIEIFTSFHSLVDALADEAGSGTSRGARGGDVSATGQATEAGDKTGDKTGDDAASVIAVDLAALLFQAPVAPQGTGGTASKGAAESENHGPHAWTAADLAALLRGGRGTFVPGANGPGGDRAPAGAGDVVDVPVGEKILLPESARNALMAEQAIDTKSAQAMAQRLLASAAGARQLTEELAGQAGAGSGNNLDDLIRQSLLNPDRTPGAANPASRLVASLTSAVAAAAASSSAAPVVAGDVSGPASAATELLSTDTTDQIIQTIRLQMTRGGGEAQIRLEPRQFGDLTVSVHVDQGQVVARLSADTAVVREWLQANEHLLRQSLADQHLTLTRLEVSEPSAESRQRAPRDGNGQAPSDDPPARRPRTPETGETFDVVA